LRGGDYVTGDTITRFYAAHVVLLPLVLGAFLVAHLGMIQAQGMSLPVGMAKEKVRDAMPFFGEFLLVELCIWLVVFGAIVTLAVLLPAEVGVKADPTAAAPAGIKPEWYFLFLFQTLKHVPESLGVLLFALGAAFLFAVPFLDRKANRQQRSAAFTILFVLLVVYAVVFQTWAAITPGVDHPPEPALSDAARLARNVVSLALFWAVIGFLIVYLLQLRAENTRIRKLYR
jgi:cytochrome b6